jgi:hypothetical protein
MNPLTRFWHDTTARFKKPFRHREKSSMAASMRAGGEPGNTVVQLERVRDRFSTAGKAETARMASMEQRLAELETEHAATQRQLQIVEKDLAVTGTDLENTHARVNTLAQELEDGRRLYLQTVQETQLQLRKQDMRLNWLTLVSAFALLLAVVACAILIWDVQKNASLLAAMSADIKQLVLSVDRQDGQSQSAAQDTQAGEAGTPHMKLPPLPDRSSMPSPAPLQPIPEFLPAPDEIPAGMDAAPVDEIRQFFERNATMPGIVSLPSGVQYRVVKPGNGRSPDLDDWVVVDYLGMTRDGSIFDNTYDSGQRAIFGMDGLLPGWQEPLLQMQEGAEFEVYVPPGIANIGGIPSLNKPDMEPGIYLIELIQVVEVGEGG